MATNLVMPHQQASPNDASLPLYDQVARFHGNQFRFLLAALKYPGQTTMWLATQAGISDASVYKWAQANPTFANLWRQIQAMDSDLRMAYAQSAFLEATPDIADAMISRAKGDRKDSQRAGERILETVGVLRSEKQTDIALSITDRAMQMWVRRQEGSQVRQASVTATMEPETQADSETKA